MTNIFWHTCLLQFKSTALCRCYYTSKYDSNYLGNIILCSQMFVVFEFNSYLNFNNVQLKMYPNLITSTNIILVFQFKYLKYHCFVINYSMFNERCSTLFSSCKSQIYINFVPGLICFPSNALLLKLVAMTKPQNPKYFFQYVIALILYSQILCCHDKLAQR